MKTRTQTRKLLAAASIGLIFSLTACSGTDSSDLSQTSKSEDVVSESASDFFKTSFLLPYKTISILR